MVQNIEANMYQQFKLQTYVNNGDEMRNLPYQMEGKDGG
jgi:hypothetical protein